MLEDSILETVRDFIVGKGNKEFDNELIPHVNSNIAKLTQAGVGNKNVIVLNEDVKWIDLKDEKQTKGNEYFYMVPLFVILSTQILFDPPPPSNVEYHSNSAKELLWRLKIAYEEVENVEPTTPLRS